MSLTEAQLNAMPRLVPSKALPHTPPPRRSYPLGPAGIPVPPSGAAYRPQADQDLLKRLAQAAACAHEIEQLPAAAGVAVGEAIAAALEASHPAADIQVLARYGLTKPTRSVAVMLERPGDYQAPTWVELPAVHDLPAGAARMRLPGAFSDDAIVPAATVEWFETVLAVRAVRRELSTPGVWVSAFHLREKRWPRWAEIAAGLPVLGAWLADQRDPV
ncbi:MAG: hypothetical protein PGN09_07500 [Sphingomonas fennica]